MYRIFISYLGLQAISMLMGTANSYVETRVGLTNFVALGIVTLFTQVTYTVPTAYSVCGVKVWDKPQQYGYLLKDVVRKTLLISIALQLVFIPICSLMRLDASVIRSGSVLLVLSNLGIMIQSPAYVCKRYHLANNGKKLFILELCIEIVRELLYITAFLYSRSIYVMVASGILSEALYTILSVRMYGSFTWKTERVTLSSVNLGSIWRERLYVKVYRLICGQILTLVGTTLYAVNQVLKRLVGPIFDMACKSSDAIHLSGEITFRKVCNLTVIVILMSTVYTGIYIWFSDTIFNGILTQNKWPVFAIAMLYNILGIVYNNVRGVLRVENKDAALERASKLMLFVTPCVMLLFVHLVPTYAYLLTNCVEYTVCICYYSKEATKSVS